MTDLAIVRTRDSLLDLAKGFGVLSVLLGHVVYYDGAVSKVIFWFHMPLFFIVSGALFNARKPILSRLLKNICIPFCFFFIIGLLVKSIFQFDEIERMSATALLSSISKSPFGNGQLWFLTVLAEVQVICFILDRARVSRVFSILACAALVFLFNLLQVGGGHHFMWHCIPAATFFYLCGTLSSAVRNKLSQMSLVACVLFSLLVLVLAATVSLRVNLRTGEVSICGLLCSLVLCAYVFAVIGHFPVFAKRILEYVGCCSLFFFACESPVRVIVVNAFNMFGCLVPACPWRTEFNGSVACWYFLVMVMVVAGFAYATRPCLVRLQDKFAKVYAVLDDIEGRFFRIDCGEKICDDNAKHDHKILAG